MNVFVILATYNEKENISQLITIFEEEVFPKIKNHSMHILVADDNSPDGTGEVVSQLMKNYKNLYINSGEKKGLGAAYIRAMTNAIEEHNAQILIELDSDLQHDPKNVPTFLKKLDEGYDLVIGTRYSNGGTMPPNWPLKRKIFSIGANILMRVITGRFHIHDWTGGYRAFRKEVFLQEKEYITPYQGYTFQVAFLYKSILNGYKVVETPIHFQDRTNGDSKIVPIEYIVNVLSYIVTARFREIVFGKFGKFLAVGGLGLIINFTMLKILSDVYHWDHAVANLFGAAVAIFSNFNLNNTWTFKEHRITSWGKYFWKLLHFYATSAFGVIILQTGVIFLGDRLIGEGTLHMIVSIPYYYVYFVIGTGLVLIWNFFIYNKFIWKKHPQ